MSLSRAVARRVAAAAVALVVGAANASRPDPQDADALYLPTPPAVVEAMLDLAKLGPGDVVYDLGAGDGRIAIAAARRAGVRAVGIELDARKAAEARANVARAGLEGRVRIVRGDVLAEDLSAATVVTVFLFPGINRALAPRLQALRPGTRIVSHRFGLGDWPPEREIVVDGHPVYRWTVPARRR